MRHLYSLIFLGLSLCLALPAVAQESLQSGPTTTDAVPYRDSGGFSFTHSTDTNVAGGGVACAVTGTSFTTENQYLRVFDLSTFSEVTGDFNVTSVDIGVSPVQPWIPSTITTTVNLYTMEGGVDFSTTFSRATLTNVGSTTFDFSSTDPVGVYSIEVMTDEPLSPTDTLVVEWDTPDGSVTKNEFGIRLGGNDGGESGATYLATTSSCGGIQPTDQSTLGSFTNSQWVMVVNGALDTANESGTELPATISLGSSYPNPFRTDATIPFTLTEASDVRLAVYDVLGREVAVLADGPYAVGPHTVTLDARALPSGTYVYRLEANGEVQMQTVTLTR